MTHYLNADNKKLKLLINEYYSALCHFACGLIDDSAAAEDIVSQVFYSFSNLKNSSDTESNVKAWFYVSVRNRCLNHLRDEKRRQLKYKIYSELEQEWNTDTWNKQLEAQVLEMLMKGVEQLPDECKRIFKMIYLDGLDTKEVAGLLKIHVDTVRSQKRRGITLLKDWASENKLSMVFALILLLEQQPEKFFKIF